MEWIQQLSMNTFAAPMERSKGSTVLTTQPPYSSLLVCGFLCFLVGSVASSAALLPHHTTRCLRKCCIRIERARQLSKRYTKVVQNPAVQDGAALTRQVPPHRWGVSREDLVHFRRMVQDAISKGDIQPTESDQFDLLDDKTGPSIYTVNQQLIMPVTAAAGNVSWALMQHSEGMA